MRTRENIEKQTSDEIRNKIESYVEYQILCDNLMIELLLDIRELLQEQPTQMVFNLPEIDQPTEWKRK